MALPHDASCIHQISDICINARLRQPQDLQGAQGHGQSRRRCQAIYMHLLSCLLPDCLQLSTVMIILTPPQPPLVGLHPPKSSSAP